jgi:hypothetical protein
MPNLNKKPTKLHSASSLLPESKTANIILTKNKISSISLVEIDEDMISEHSNPETTNAERTAGLNEKTISVFDDQKVHTQVHISEPSDKPITSSPVTLISLDPLTTSSSIAHPSTIKPSPSEIRPITTLFFKFIYV